jgi:hypothetical protein
MQRRAVSYLVQYFKRRKNRKGRFDMKNTKVHRGIGAYKIVERRVPIRRVA